MHYNEKRQFVLLVFCIPFESLFTIWNYFDRYETFKRCVNFMNMLNVKVYITSEVRRKV